MEAAARALLILIAVALFVNYAQGGGDRVKRWAVRTLTGRDLLAPPPPAAKATTSRPRPVTAATSAPTYHVWNV